MAQLQSINRIDFFKRTYYVFKFQLSTGEVTENDIKLHNFQNMVAMRIFFFMCIMCMVLSIYNY